jgi:hypothetical protein
LPGNGNPGAAEAGDVIMVAAAATVNAAIPNVRLIFELLLEPNGAAKRMLRQQRPRPTGITVRGRCPICVIWSKVFHL